MSLTSPYWYWNKVLSLKEIKKINKFIINNYDELEDESFKATDINNKSKKNTNTYIIGYPKVKKYIHNLVENCYIINNRNYNYDLWPYDKQGCHYNIYKGNEKSNYDWHTDASREPYSDMKLTVLINLSEKPFEGGDLFLQENNTIEVKELKEIGSMIMFKSHIRHMVSPVTNGERKNLTLFLTGPNFK
jgi:Rps23 Pro-64 3,4-dihydroxylase Tpa1-like proline 4-hydroxylase